MEILRLRLRKKCLKFGKKAKKSDWAAASQGCSVFEAHIYDATALFGK